jgi:Zn-dependent M28 family amino/carboxypeptidase
VTQPPRFDEKPTSFVVTIENGKVLFDKEVLWTEARPTLSGKVLAAPLEFSPSLKKQYKQDVKVLAGEEPAVFPISKRTLIFERKNNIQTDHQLNEMTAYLKERYSILGLKTFEQSFEWRGLKHSNLIAVIPGSNKSESNKPVILADHFDTAFAEDVFAQSGQRVAAPGADDNYTATAALLSAAAVLKNSSPKHDIWLLHLTGEEFPADDLGARKFIEFMLEKKKAISGILLMDMIGHNPEGKKLFQINAGSSAESEMLGHISQQISKQIAPGRTPALRSRFSPYSYLYNTDGRVFSAFGFPVVLFNEHLNGKFRLYRDGYHMTNDDSSKIDWDYALDIFKVVTTTAVTVAHQD